MKAEWLAGFASSPSGHAQLGARTRPVSHRYHPNRLEQKVDLEAKYFVFIKITQRICMRTLQLDCSFLKNSTGNAIVDR